MPEKSSKDITLILRDARAGDKEALNALYEEVYHPLKEIAGKLLSYERPDHTLQKTSLVHELYIKLINQKEVKWEDRAHFFAMASNCMRQILVDYARRKAAKRRGGNPRKITLDENLLNMEEHAEDIIRINELIDKLAGYDERKSKVVEMRFFGGMGISEIAEVLNVTPRTVDRDWAKAKIWLYSELVA